MMDHACEALGNYESALENQRQRQATEHHS